MAFDFSRIFTDPRILSSIISAGGGILEGIGDRGDRREDREFSAEEREKDRLQQQRMAIANFLNGMRGDERADLIQQENRDTQGAAAQLTALGGPFDFASQLQKQRTRRELLGGAQNVSISAPADIEGSRGHLTGGLRVPEGGFDVRALSDDALGENARAYLTTIAQLNPRGTTLDVGSMGLNGGITGNVESARQGYLATDDARRQELRDLDKRREAEIMGYLTGSGPVGPNGAPAAPPGVPSGQVPTQNGPQLDGGNDAMRGTDWWQAYIASQGFKLDGSPIRLNDNQRKELQRIAEQHGMRFDGHMQIDPAGNVNQDQGVSRVARGVANGAMIAAPIAANFIPGVGPIASAAISGGTSALRTKMNGGSWADAAKSGAIGAGANYAMGKIPGNPFRIPRSGGGVALPDTLTSPAGFSSSEELIRRMLLGVPSTGMEGYM